MTAFTNSKIISSKSALSVVTAHATEGLARGMMIRRFRSSYLLSLGHAGPHRMTFSTRQPGLTVLSVTETHGESF